MVVCCVGINYACECLYRSNVAASLAIKRKEGGTGARISLPEQLDILCATLEQLQSKLRVFAKAYKSTAMGGPVHQLFDTYRQINTWTNGMLMRDEKGCPPIDQMYLDALFLPLNMARDVAEPMVVPTSFLRKDLVDEWRLSSDDVIVEGQGQEQSTSSSTTSVVTSSSSTAVLNEYALITIDAMWAKVGRDVQQVHTWRTKGKIITVEEEVHDSHHNHSLKIIVASVIILL